MCSTSRRPLPRYAPRPRLDPPDFAAITDGVEVVIPVSVTDKMGTEVVHADITCWVTPAH
jgi:hypothetical protein